MKLDRTAVLRDFQEEAIEHLDRLNTQLLALERDPTALEPIRAMFLSAHTIKGSAAMLELMDIRMLAHAMEDVLAHLRDTRRTLDTPTADLLFRAVDALRERVGRSVPGGIDLDPAAAGLVAALCDRAGGGAEGGALPGPAQDMAVVTPRALLVDDSATVRMLETMQLADAGFQVDAATDGRQALALALANDYDLIVTGVECQVLRGWDLAAALHEVVSRRSVPIIIMSSDDIPKHRQRAEEAGLHAYLRKGSLATQRLEEAARKLTVGSRRSAGNRGGE